VTDREELQERLDTLETKFRVDTDEADDIDTSDWEEYIEEQLAEAKEILSPERWEHVCELEEQIEREGPYADETDALGRQQMSTAAKKWHSIVIGETAEVWLEQNGL